jgi:DNA-binding IclR family transcriptional regulator
MDDHTVTGRITAILDAVARLDDAATLAELTRATAIPKPTVRRISAALVARGLLRRHADRYQLGPRILELGAHAARRDRMREAATPHMQDLFARTREIVWLSALTETSNALVQATFGHNRSMDMGKPWPTAIHSAHFMSTATGRMLLAERPDLAEAHLFRPLPRMTPYTPPSQTRVAAAVAAARDNGYAIENEESLLGYRCIAVPLHNTDQDVIATIGVLGRVGSFAPERIIHPLLAAATEIERQLNAADRG